MSMNTRRGRKIMSLCEVIAKKEATVTPQDDESTNTILGELRIAYPPNA
jgi:hypothetical protein